MQSVMEFLTLSRLFIDVDHQSFSDCLTQDVRVVQVVKHPLTINSHLLDEQVEIGQGP